VTSKGNLCQSLVRKLLSFRANKTKYIAKRRLASCVPTSVEPIFPVGKHLFRHDDGLWGGRVSNDVTTLLMSIPHYKLPVTSRNTSSGHVYICQFGTSFTLWAIRQEPITKWPTDFGGSLTRGGQIACVQLTFMRLPKWNCWKPKFS